MNMTIYIKIFLLILILPVFSQNSTVLNFLKWSIDPVSAGTGESGTAAFSGGGQSFLLNPANINAFGKWDVFYSGRSLRTSFPEFRNLDYFLAGGNYRFDERNIAGIYVRRFSYKTTFFAPLSQPSEFNAFDLAITATYGRKLGGNWSAGLGFQYLKSDLGSADATSWAFDIGVNRVNLIPALTFRVPGEVVPALQKFQTPDKTAGLNIGLALLNAGPHFAYIDQDQADPLPQRLRLGILYQIISSPILSLQGLFDFEKELIRGNAEETKYDSFVKSWVTGWQGKTFKESVYHFGMNLQFFSIASFRYGYQYEPFQNFSAKGVSTIGLGIDLKYISVHYGTWIDKENISNIMRDSNVVSIQVGNN